jgi:hypothetical protein
MKPEPIHSFMSGFFSITYIMSIFFLSLSISQNYGFCLLHFILFYGILKRQAFSMHVIDKLKAPSTWNTLHSWWSLINSCFTKVMVFSGKTHIVPTHAVQGKLVIQM